MDKPRDIQLEQTIDAYIKGTLSEDEIQVLWVELLERPEYIDRLETEIDVARFYKGQAHQQKGLSHYWRWMGAAAAVILVVICVNVFTESPPKTLRQWTTGSIDITKNLATAPVKRSASTVSAPDSLLNAGFKAAIDGRTQQAMAIYQNIITHYKSPVILRKAHLNLGILMYNEGHFHRSIPHFKLALKGSSANTLPKEQAYWYLGNAYINVNKLSLARNAILKAYQIGKLYKPEEYNLLKRVGYKLSNVDR